MKESLLEVFVKQFVFGEVRCKMSAISPVSRSCFRINVMRMVQTISVVIDWHVGNWATINSCKNNPTWGYSCLFYGLIFVGQDAEGTLHRKEYLTICQNWISGDAYCWNQDIFIYFKDSSGHPQCHWNWRHELHFKLTVLQFQMWQDVLWIMIHLSQWAFPIRSPEQCSLVTKQENAQILPAKM